MADRWPVRHDQEEPDQDETIARMARQPVGAYRPPPEKPRWQRPPVETSPPTTLGQGVAACAIGLGLLLLLWQFLDPELRSVGESFTAGALVAGGAVWLYVRRRNL